MSTEIIKLENVKRTFQVAEIQVHALQDINVSINQGEFVIILGASGSGKTTLLNQIGGIDTPTEGNVIVKGENITQYSDKELTIHRRSRIGWIFQFYNLIPSLTAVENVQLALEMMNEHKNQRQRSIDALRAVGLDKEEDRFPAQLSGGQQQRVAIARALVKRPEIIVADEPTGNLDRKTGEIIIDVMVDICKKEGITFCTVTHDPTLARVADRVLIMEDGVLYENENEKLASYGVKR